jgi:G3E family GTPase
VDPNLIFGLESKLFLEAEQSPNATHHEEVETVTVIRASNPGRQRNLHAHGSGEYCPAEEITDTCMSERAMVEEEALVSALTVVSKETVWRIKGFVRLNGGVHILNWAFGRYELTRMEGGSEDEETVRLTVMGARGEVRRVAEQFAAALQK